MEKLRRLVHRLGRVDPRRVNAVGYLIKAVATLIDSVTGGGGPAC